MSYDVVESINPGEVDDPHKGARITSVAAFVGALGLGLAGGAELSLNGKTGMAIGTEVAAVIMVLTSVFAAARQDERQPPVVYVGPEQ